MPAPNPLLLGQSRGWFQAAHGCDRGTHLHDPPYMTPHGFHFRESKFPMVFFPRQSGGRKFEGKFDHFFMGGWWWVGGWIFEGHRASKTNAWSKPTPSSQRLGLKPLQVWQNSPPSPGHGLGTTLIIRPVLPPSSSPPRSRRHPRHTDVTRRAVRPALPMEEERRPEGGGDPAPVGDAAAAYQGLAGGVGRCGA